MNSRNHDVYVALNIMLNSFANQCGYSFDVVDECARERVHYIFGCRPISQKYAHVVSYYELRSGHVYSLMEYITGKVEVAFDKAALEKTRGLVKAGFAEYVDTDIKLTKETREYIKRVTNRACGRDIWPKENPWLKKEMAIPKPGDRAPEIKDVIFKDPATIVFWSDGTKTVVKTQEGDIYDPEKGLAMAICKKRGGNKWDYYNTFKHWLKKCKPETGDVETVTHITKTIKEDNNGDS